MKQGFLAQESERINRASRKTSMKLIIVFVCALAIIYFGARDSIDFSDMSVGTIPFYLAVLVGIMVVCTVIRLIASGRAAGDGSNLLLPFGESAAEAAQIIDREAQEGKILVEEYIEEFADEKKAHGEKIVLLPTYLLLCGINGGPKGTSRVMAIPRSKIYWICAQVGYKGGPFRVRLLIFTEHKMYSLTGVDIEHVQRIAEKIYRYIPNVFSDYDPFELSYELEKMFAKNPVEFFDFYEKERSKKIAEE